MLGHYFRSLDDKKRVIVPAKFRKELGDHFFLTIGLDNVLVLMDSDSFITMKSKLLDNNMFNKNARTFARILLGNTVETEFDSQGRIVIPEPFIKKALITKDVTFVGVGDKVELWPAKAFETFQKQFEGEGTLDELAQKLLKDGAEL